MSPASERRWLLAACAAAVLLRIGLLWGSFVDYDDGILIYENEVVAHPSWRNAWKLLTTNFRGEAQNGMHLANLASMEWTNGRYAGFAALNLGWLAFTVVAVHAFATRFVADRRWALVAAWGFATHVVITDTFAWMSARGHALGLPLALLAFVAWEARARAGTRRAWALTGLGLLLAALATWCKAFWFTTFPLLVLHDLVRGGRPTAWRLVGWGFAALGAFVALQIPPMGGGLRDHLAAPSPELAHGRLAILLEYLWTTFVPRPTSIVIFHTLPRDLFDTDAVGLLFLGFPPALNLLAALAVVGGLGWLRVRHGLWQPWLLAVSAVVVLIPSTTWRPIEPGLAFEFRYALFPAACATVAAATVLARAWPAAGTYGRALLAGTVGAFLLAHAVRTVEQTATWRDGEAHYLRCVEAYPVTVLCHERLANLARADGRVEDAERWLREANAITSASGLLRRTTIPLGLAELARARGDREAERRYLVEALARGRYTRPQRASIAARLRQVDAASR